MHSQEAVGTEAQLRVRIETLDSELSRAVRERHLATDREETLRQRLAEREDAWKLQVRGGCNLMDRCEGCWLNPSFKSKAKLPEGLGKRFDGLMRLAIGHVTSSPSDILRKCPPHWCSCGLIIAGGLPRGADEAAAVAGCGRPAGSEAHAAGGDQGDG